MTPGFLALIGDEGPARSPWTGGVESSPGVGVWFAHSHHEDVRGPKIAVRGDLIAAADLRIDNREALRDDLGLIEGSDVNLLLAGVERWGAAVVERLEGPFAFVVWDGHEAIVARDALGLRPLYHARRGRGIVLGSSLAAVRSLAPGTVCTAAVVDYVAGRFDHPHLTLTEGVERVPAGHVGTVTLDGRSATLSLRRYWTLDPPPASGGNTDAEAAFRGAFDRSVSARLDTHTGALLSGGLDSSSVVATAAVLGHALPTFSLVYDDPAADERRFLDAVAAHVGTEPVRVAGESVSLLRDLDDDLRAVGEPFATPNLFLARRLYAEAAAHGLHAVLDGFAGDNVVGHGDRWLTELAWTLQWGAFAREVRGAARRSRRPWRALAALTWDYALSPLAEPFRRPSWGFLRRDWIPAKSPRAPMRVRERDLHHADVAGPALARAFETTYARASALGIEPRFPFADRRLVEVCASLPPSQRVRDGLTRSILRRALADRLPGALLSRTSKARLGQNFNHALFERDPLLLREFVEHDVPAAAAYLDVAAVQSAYRRGAANVEARGAVALPLWRAVSLARWLSLSSSDAATAPIEKPAEVSA